VSKAVESAAGVTGEVKRAGRSGDRVLEMQAAPLRDSDGNPAGAVVVLHDVTQLRRLETVRQDFVANVSHELKTPLTAIRGLVETLLDDGAMDEATRQRFLTKLRDQTARVSALMTDLLAISQIESRETALEVEMLDLRDPIRESLKALLPSAEKKGVTVESEVPDEPVTESCDAEAIRRVFDNLLDNAVKYTPEEGRVWVRLRTEGDSALVEVADTGIGIEPRDQERIFERFYRVDKARSRELGGTGLGLSIVKHIVQAHGGEVSVESVPGRGSTFRVRLPLAS